MALVNCLFGDAAGSKKQIQKDLEWSDVRSDCPDEKHNICPEERREIILDQLNLRCLANLFDVNFPIPAKVEERLDAIMRNSLWNGNKENKRFHLVKRKTVNLPSMGAMHKKFEKIEQMLAFEMAVEIPLRRADTLG